MRVKDTDIKNEFKDLLKETFEFMKRNFQLKWLTDSHGKEQDFDSFWDTDCGFGRLMLYFLYNEFAPIEEQIDCDASFQVMSNYLKRIPSKGKDMTDLVNQTYGGKTMKYKYKIVVGDQEMFSDTLTSIWSPLRLWFRNPEVYEKQFAQEERKLQLNEETGTYRVPNAQIRLMETTIDMELSNKGRWAVYIFVNLDHFENLLTSDMKEVLKSYHTPSNFFMVPPYFNTGSAGANARNDYGDLKLDAIRNFYTEGYGNTEALEKLFEDIKVTEKVNGKTKVNKEKTKMRKDATLQSAVEWLSDYENWEDFLNKNDVGNYLDENNEPIQLWQRHHLKQIPDWHQIESLFAQLKVILK